MKSSVHFCRSLSSEGNQMTTYTDRCKVHVEDSASHEHTACTLMTGEDTPGEDACDQGGDASHDLGVVHTDADGEEGDNMTLAWVSK